MRASEKCLKPCGVCARIKARTLRVKLVLFSNNFLQILVQFLCVEEKGFGTFCFRRTKDKIISLSSVCGSFFVALFFFACCPNERSERFRDGSLHSSPLEQQRKEF